MVGDIQHWFAMQPSASKGEIKHFSPLSHRPGQNRPVRMPQEPRSRPWPYPTPRFWPAIWGQTMSVHQPVMLCYSSIFARDLRLTQSTVMAEFAGNPLPSWQDLAASTGFGVLCLCFPEGERFTFTITDPTKAREHGLRATEVFLLESELRAQLTLD